MPNWLDRLRGTEPVIAFWARSSRTGDGNGAAGARDRDKEVPLWRRKRFSVLDGIIATGLRLEAQHEIIAEECRGGDEQIRLSAGDLKGDEPGGIALPRGGVEEGQSVGVGAGGEGVRSSVDGGCEGGGRARGESAAGGGQGQPRLGFGHSPIERR